MTSSMISAAHSAHPLEDRPTAKPVRAHRRVWNGAVFDMDEDIVEVTDGREVARHYVAHTGAVAIVAVRHWDTEPEILLVSQYRHPVRATLWEIPAGLLDIEGEDPLAAAQRELWEEADMTATTWRVLVDYFTSPGGSTEGLRIYWASGVEQVPAQTRHQREDEELEMETRWVVLSEVVEAVLDGRLHNPSLVAGALAAWAWYRGAAGRDGDGGRLPGRDSEAPWLRSPMSRVKEITVDPR